MTELSKEEIIIRLQKLAKQPPPKNLQPGAMCYKKADPPNRMEYICPECGGKTLYAREGSVETGKRMSDLVVISDISWRIEACRRLVDNIKKIHAKLDESQFCSYCSPDTEHPRLGLIISYPDEDKPHSVYGINTENLTMIIEFLNGEIRHTYPNAKEIPLKNQIKQLETLFGVSLK